MATSAANETPGSRAPRYRDEHPLTCFPLTSRLLCPRAELDTVRPCGDVRRAHTPVYPPGACCAPWPECVQLGCPPAPSKVTPKQVHPATSLTPEPRGQRLPPPARGAENQLLAHGDAGGCVTASALQTGSRRGISTTSFTTARPPRPPKQGWPDTDTWAVSRSSCTETPQP